MSDGCAYDIIVFYLSFYLMSFCIHFVLLYLYHLNPALLAEKGHPELVGPYKEKEPAGADHLRKGLLNEEQIAFLLQYIPW